MRQPQDGPTTALTIADVASLVRSKNAGPFTLTIDVLASDPASFASIIGSPIADVSYVAALYGLPAEDVRISVYEPGLGLKIAMPRGITAGDVGDGDVFGGQQYGPIASAPVHRDHETVQGGT